MEEKDFIKELFQEKLAQHQSPVSPELWASVSSSITSGTTVVSSGLSLLAKSLIGGLSAAAVIGGVWMLTQQNTSSKKSVSSHQIKKPLAQTSSNDENPAIKLTVEEGTYDGCVFLIPEIPQVDNGPSFGPGMIHSGSETDVTVSYSSNREPDVLPMVPFNNIQLEDETIEKVISENQIATNGATSDNGKLDAIQLEEKIVLPNIFTPNGDGKNDEFSIDLSDFEFLDYSLVILDMNNQAVFKSTHPQESWNGKKEDGENCKAGNYIYYLTGKTVSGKTISKYATLRIQY